MIDITLNPRITQLLSRAERIEQEVKSAGQGTPQRAQLREELDDVYGELGRYVGWLMTQDPKVVERIRKEGEAWAEGLRSGSSSTPAPIPELAISAVESIPVPTEEGVVAKVLAKLGPPDVPKTNSAVLGACTALLAATAKMERTWGTLPKDHCHTLISLCACRLRQLERSAKGDAGKQLGRLHVRLIRVQKALGVAAVTALESNPTPAFGSWSGDLRRWWMRADALKA